MIGDKRYNLVNFSIHENTHQVDGPKKDDALEILLEHHSTNSNENNVMYYGFLGDESNHFLWSLSKDLEKGIAMIHIYLITLIVIH